MTSEQITQDYISGIIKSLLIFKPYYGYALSRLERKIEHIPCDESRFGTLCVSAQDMTIWVNAEFMAETGDPEFHSHCFEHEVCHIALKHFERFRLIMEDENTTDVEKHIVNIAMDLAINEIIKFIDSYGRHTFSTLKNITKAFNVELEPMQTAEWYYRKLMETDVAKKNINDEEKFIEALKEVLKDIDKMLRNLKKTHEKCFNDHKIRPVPSKLREMLREGASRQRTFDRKRGVGKGDSILDFIPAEVNQYDREVWKKLVDKNLGDELVAEVDIMWGRPSRRRDDSLWWNKHQTHAKTLYVGFDTSASVVCDDDRMVSRMLGYLSRGLRSNNCDATLILCDDGIQEVRRIRSVSLGKEFKLMGAGGTDLRKILEYIEKNDKTPKLARLILFTDGETPWRESVVRTSVVYTPKHEKLKGNIMSWAVMEPTLLY